jgi:asparagine synthase (glutamine-hydrolysing)
VRALLADGALSREPDLQAINEFLVFDHVLDDRTLLKAVRLMPQGSLMTFQRSRLEIRPYWKLQYPELYEPRSEGEYAEQLLHHLRQAVKRQQPGSRPAALLLSGGLDSRLLLGLLYEGYAGESFRTFTWGIPGCDDARFSRELAARIGARHQFFELRSDWLLNLAESAVRSTDGLGNLVNLHAIAALDEESRYAQVMYKGFLGDALLGFAVKRQMWADYDPEIQHRVHLQCHDENGVINYAQDELKALLSRELQAKTGDRIYRAYRAGMARSGVTQLANQRLFFDLTQRVPRMTLNGVEVMRSRTIVRLPFADNDLLKFVLTVPPGYLFERYLTRAVVSRYYPELAKVPMTPSNTPLVPCARGLFIQARQLTEWHLKKAGLQRLAGTGQRPYKDYNGWFRTILRPWVEDTLLSTRALNRGYFNPEYVRKLVSAQMKGENHAVRLGALLTLELWQRRLES